MNTTFTKKDKKEILNKVLRKANQNYEKTLQSQEGESLESLLENEIENI